MLNGIFWVLRSGAPWRDLPESYGPYTTCYNRFVRWRQAGIWDHIMEALAAGHDAAVQMIDTSVVRVHQHGACISDNNHQAMGRSRGGLTSKIHAVGLPLVPWGTCRVFDPPANSRAIDEVGSRPGCSMSQG